MSDLANGRSISSEDSGRQRIVHRRNRSRKRLRLSTSVSIMRRLRRDSISPVDGPATDTPVGGSLIGPILLPVRPPAPRDARHRRQLCCGTSFGVTAGIARSRQRFGFVAATSAEPATRLRHGYRCCHGYRFVTPPRLPKTRHSGVPVRSRRRLPIRSNVPVTTDTNDECEHCACSKVAMIAATRRVNRRRR
jgi:hypothetical protein